MKIDLIKTAPENCPSYDICQFNDCPLELKSNDYKTLECDKQLYNKCRCSKKKRMEIANVFSMKSLGLTKREFENRRKSIDLKKRIEIYTEKT